MSQKISTSSPPAPGCQVPPGFFSLRGNLYRSTALTLYVFTVSQNANAYYDSDSVTRSINDKHVPVQSSDGDRKEIGKLVLSEYSRWMELSVPPQFGVQMKIDILPHYEEGLFQFVQLILSTVLQDEFTRYGAVAPTIKLTVYTASDYFLWLNNLPFLRMLLNRAVASAGLALRERFRVLHSGSKGQKPKEFQLRGYKPFEEEARVLARLVSEFLGAQNLLPSLSARPRRTLPAPHLFRAEYGSTTAEALGSALKILGTQPAFLSAIIVGCMSCSNWGDYIGGSGGRDGVGKVNYSHYYNNELPMTRVSRSAKVVEDGWADDDPYVVDEGACSDADSYTPSGSQTPYARTASGGLGLPSGGTKEDGEAVALGRGAAQTTVSAPKVSGTIGQSRKPFSCVPGGAWQTSRIVVVGQGWKVLPILMVCIFFYKRGRMLSAADPSRFLHLFGDVAEDLLPSYIAGQTGNLATGYPIQWVEKDSLTKEDYDELFDPTNDEGSLLIIDAAFDKVTRYELEKSFLEPGDVAGPNGEQCAGFGSFSLDRATPLELHGDETVMGWLEEAAALAGTCAVDFYLQEQLTLTYHRALLYEQLVRSGMLDPYDFTIGFVTVKPPPKPPKGGRGAAGSNATAQVGSAPNGLPLAAAGGASGKGYTTLTAGALSSRNARFMGLTRPDHMHGHGGGSDTEDTRSEGGSSVGSGYGGARHLGRKVSTMAGGGDDNASTTSSIAPSPLHNVADVQTRVWLADVRSRATDEERFVMENRIRVESMLGVEYTPSHGQLLHLLRFQQPILPEGLDLNAW